MIGEPNSPSEDWNYQSYLLRLWRTTCDRQTIWRASLENPHTGQRLGFASLEALFDHLRARTAQTEKGGDS
jgi:hypothetical protein